MAKKGKAKKAPAKKKAKVTAKPVKSAKKAAKPVKKAAPAKKAVKKTAKPAAKKATKPVAKKAVKAKPVKKVAAKTPAKKSAPVKATAPKAQPAKPTVKIDYSKAITPLGDRLVIRLTQTERVSAGGLILPDSVSSTSGFLKGEVLAAGHGTYTKKGHHKLLDVKVGDVVLFNEYSSTRIKFNNEDLHIVHENEILGVTE